MTYIVNAGVAPLCHSQDHPGGVPVTMSSTAAPVTPESLFAEPQLLLGSREATGARHGRVPGRDEHQLTVEPVGEFDQPPLHRPDRGISRLSRHCRFDEELRFEVLHGDQLMVLDDPSCPDPGVVLSLASRLLLQSRGLPLGGDIPARWFRAYTSASRHLALYLCELGGAALPMPKVWQIVALVGGSRGRRYTPVDTNGAFYSGNRRIRSSDDERRIPMTNGILVHTDRGWLGRQFAGPHYGDRCTFRQHQTPVANRETPSREFQRGESALPRFLPRSPPVLQFERVGQRLPVIAQHLLLRDLRARPQPLATGSRLGKHPRERAHSRHSAGTLLMHCLVPQEPAAMPLRDKCSFCRRARSQAVGVTHDLPHSRTITRGTDMYRQPCSMRTARAESAGSTGVTR
ncbi:hypothetical protein SAMN04490220_3452 [Rhodococcus jostii]|uniref:Uncharacterized protein n=1 Tax=Rhodococcus jostii TaxID=132919 RepID=A0A1H4XS92_RHOJO|nr:hypothetical protein SAMN04490220_3452 [Rhodococcus jostii]